MEKKIKNILKVIKMNETNISTVMGGLVVVIVGLFMFNYFKSLNLKGLIIKPLIEGGDTVSLEQKNSETGSLPTTYKVVKGDDLWHISEKFYKSGYNYVDIAKASSLKNPSRISEGMELTIPAVEAKKLTVLTKDEVKPKANLIEGSEYVVVKGDSLWSIALRAYGDGYAWTRIYNANQKVVGSNPSAIEKGMKLNLPR